MLSGACSINICMGVLDKAAASVSLSRMTHVHTTRTTTRQAGIGLIVLLAVANSGICLPHAWEQLFRPLPS